MGCVSPLWALHTPQTILHAFRAAHKTRVWFAIRTCALFYTVYCRPFQVQQYARLESVSRKRACTTRSTIWDPILGTLLGDATPLKEVAMRFLSKNSCGGKLAQGSYARGVFVEVCHCHKECIIFLWAEGRKWRYHPPVTSFWSQS